MENNSSVQVGRRYKLIFQDAEKVLIKRGIILSYDALFIVFKNVSGVEEIIPMNRVLRLEAEDGS